MSAEPIVVSLIVGFIMASVIVGVCGADETWEWLCGLVGLPPTFTQDVGASDGDWCAGCDQIVPRSRMAWDDGRYRCDMCRNPPPPKRGVTDGGVIKVDLDWITEGARKPAAKKPVTKKPSGDVVELFNTLTNLAWFGVVEDVSNPKAVTGTLDMTRGTPWIDATTIHVADGDPGQLCEECDMYHRGECAW